MRVFVLCSGRCGSTNFALACRHFTNYTVGHEQNTGRIGESRLAYPDDHIEVDNRLSWYLGGLGERYGDDAFYVHLTREEDDVAASFSRRWKIGIIRAYAKGIIWGTKWSKQQ